VALGLGWVDIALAAFLALSVLVGLARGVVFELLALAGWFVAFFTAGRLSPACEAYIHIGQTGTALNHAVTFAAVFFAAFLVWGLAARLVRALIRATPLSPIDRILGAGFGALRGVVVLLLVALGVGLSPLAQAPAWHDSLGVAWLNGVLQALRPAVSGESSQHLAA